jgi:hypothetical protein
VTGMRGAAARLVLRARRIGPLWSAVSSAGGRPPLHHSQMATSTYSFVTPAQRDPAARLAPQGRKSLSELPSQATGGAASGPVIRLFRGPRPTVEQVFVQLAARLL